MATKTSNPLDEQSRQVTLGRFELGLACATAATIPWDGVRFAGVRPGDLLLLLTVLLFLPAVAFRLPSLPAWIWIFVTAIVLIGISHEIEPPDSGYLGTRTVVNAVGLLTTETNTNLGAMAKVLVSAIAVPWVFVMACRMDARASRLLAASYVVGTAISGYVAYLDSLGFLSLNALPLSGPYALNRQAGLSQFTNSLGAICVLATPLAIWLACQRGNAARAAGAFSLLGIVLGVHASGSRGAAAALVVAAVITVLAVNELRRHLLTFSAAAVLAAITVFVVVPGIGSSLLSASRLISSSNTDTSDRIRSLLNQQATLDFKHSPLNGIGLEVVFEAHNVYLQVLASGGMILFVGYAVFLLGALGRVWRRRATDPLAAALLGSFAGLIVINFVENMLTNRYMYVVIGLAAALQGDASIGMPHKVSSPARRIQARLTRQRSSV